jgi:tRNA(Phe) wybutosine-synthesizing methylase Tyw3
LRNAPSKYGGKERWKYCRTLERAKHLQKVASEGGLHSIICQKVNGRYVSLNGG